MKIVTAAFQEFLTRKDLRRHANEYALVIVASNPTAAHRLEASIKREMELMDGSMRSEQFRDAVTINSVEVLVRCPKRTVEL